MSAHTPTPWEIDDLAISSVNPPEDYGDIICEAPIGWDDSMKRWEANAARIVQCVNACEGISNEDLSVKVQIQLSNLAYKVDRNAQERNKAESELESLRAERDALVEALRSIIAQWDTPNWKLTESTGTIINQARQTIAKYEK
jgi:hypothetical protein